MSGQLIITYYKAPTTCMYVLPFGSKVPDVLVRIGVLAIDVEHGL